MQSWFLARDYPANLMEDKISRVCPSKNQGVKARVKNREMFRW